MKPILILDANAFIFSIDLIKLHEKFDFISTQEALKEVRDEKARARLNSLPFNIDIREPSETAIKFVSKFARATGDMASISQVDQNLIALAYSVLEESGKTNLVRQNPGKIMEFNSIKNQYGGQQQLEPKVEDKQQELIQQQQEDDDGWETVEVKKPFRKDQIEEENNEPEVQEEILDEDDEQEDGKEGWITVDNIQDHLTGVTEVAADEKCESEKFGVAVVTADFAMQNILLQMGIPIISQEGFLVKHAKRFILECHICRVLVRDSTKMFCPTCGNSSLLKVSCSINSDGSLVLYRKRNFQVNQRGTQFTLPKSKNTKHDQFIRTEDQLLMGGIQQKIRQEQRQANKKFKQMMVNYDNGFGFDDIDYKQAKPSTKITVGYGKLNPNDVNDMRKIKATQKKK